MAKYREFIHSPSFFCADCLQEKQGRQGDGGTGYAIIDHGQPTERKICYACCDKRDLAQMAEGRPIDLYLTEYKFPTAEGAVGGPITYQITTWPGTLKIKPTYYRTGRHNIGRTRVDVWFEAAGRKWWGVNIGDNQILRCRTVKG